MSLKYHTEFLITDLALASQSIVSFTLSSFSLFKAALVKHAPQAIIIPKKLLEQVLDLIEASGRSAQHFIIVLGVEKGSSTLHSVRTGIQIMRWEDIEEQGKLLAKSDVEPPGVLLCSSVHGISDRSLDQIPAIFSAYLYLAMNMEYVLHSSLSGRTLTRVRLGAS